MPPTPTQKSLCDQESDVESEKVELVEADLLLVDSGCRSTGGAGETPVKKLLKKSTKVEDDKTGKKNNSTVIDKVPKKNAQRAKGSISLNKTVEKTNAELMEKKRLAMDSSDSISTTKEESNVENNKGSTDGRRTPVSVRNKGSKTKTSSKKPAKKDSKDPKSKIQKPWMDAEENLSTNTLEKEVAAETITKENLGEIQNNEIRPLNPPFATCSFFEKLQQGVKSYFGSKNSFTPYDKNKKEGGSQNSASVAKGVKEDAKKKEPGLILKNDIYNSESGLFHDELRSNLSLGGQSNNFSKDKPKIFRKLKRKKLYNPKKHYVRIQIPRKGYFYRSTIQFKTPGSKASGQFERLEPHDVPKSKSKIQIPRLASTSSKISNLSNKKRLKTKQENSEESSNLGSVLSGDCFSFERLDQLSSATSDEKLDCDFEQKFSDYLALHRPNRNLHSRGKKKLRLKDDKISEFMNSELERGKQMSTISERLFRSESQKAMDRAKKKALKMGNNFSEILDVTSERVLPTFRKQKKTPESTFESLIKCIDSTLGNDKLFYDLEITPVKEDLTRASTDPSTFQGFTETPFQFTEIINTFNNINCSRENFTKSETLYISPATPTTFYQPDLKPIASLMDEVDLHLELQNYLKGYDNATKNKAKSTQENSFSSDVDSLNEKKKLSKIRESKSSSSYASATSNGSLEVENGNQFRVFLDCKRDMMSLSEECIGGRLPKTFNLRSKLTEESSEVRKIKSENNPRILARDSKLNSSIKRTFGKTSFHMFLLDDKENLTLQHLSSVHKDLSAKNSVDSYEKITPFDVPSNKICNNTRTRNKSRVLFENRIYSLSAESVPQRVWKVASDTNNSEIKSSNNIKILKPVRSTLYKESPTTEMTSPAIPQTVSSTPKWSPTLQDLIDIYNSVLKQNRKIRRNSKNSVNNCFSSHLFTFLNEKLQEKQFKSNLIKLSKDFSNNCKPPKPWKLLKQKEDSVRLKEYVAMFQEILQSSLSINQITRLNNTISGLQDYSERNYSFFKDLKEAVDAESDMKKNVPIIEKIETASKTDIIQFEPISEIKPKTYFPKKSLNETSKASNLSNALPEFRSKKTKKPKSEKINAKSKEEIHEIELSGPAELKHLLRTSFDSINMFSDDPKNIKVKNKLLVTVKVSGERILVNDLTFLNNEDALSPRKTKQENTSELIIENVTRDQIRDVLHKNLKINGLKQLRSFHAKETSNTSDIKVKKGKPSKARKFQKQTQGKGKEMGSDYTSEAEHLLLQQNRLSETVFPFEYDHMQLRAQHPIDAIVESSESKISETFENFDNGKSKILSELSSMNKILFKDIHDNSAVMKEALKDALAENVFTKDLTCNFDWSEEEIGKTLGPIKSYVISRQTAKSKSAPLTKKKKIPETVRSMVDLNSKSCRKRKGRKVLPVRPPETYLCYPFLHNFQCKTLKSIQNSKEKIKDKKLTCTFSTTPSKSTIQPEVYQKVSQDFEFKRQKSEATAVKSQTPDSKAAATVNQPSSNTVLYLNDQDMSDCCSIELSLSENKKNSFALSLSGLSANQDVQTASAQLPSQVHMSALNSNHAPQAALSKVKNSPMVLHPAKGDIDDLSFSSMIIHSDSFLKCFSGFTMSRSKLKSLFKSNSDMKFYPERIPRHGSESKPFVTFVLTPKQKKMTELSSDKIHIVTRPGAAESSVAASTLVPIPVACDDPQKKTYKVKSNKSSDESFFQSFEKINESSKCRKRVTTSKQLLENPRKKDKRKLMQSSLSCNSKKKSLIPSQTSPNVDPIDRKAYHDCQKRKKESTRIDIELKKTGKTSEKNKKNQIKKIKIVQRKKKPEKSQLFFPNKIKDFIKALEIFQKNSDAENKESEKCRKKEKNETMEMISFAKKYCKNTTDVTTDDVKNPVTPKSNATDVNEATANGNSTKISSNSSNLLPELLEMLKTTLKQTENFKNKAEIISIIEKELEKKRPKLWEETMVIRESSGNSPSTPKKLKTVKIKIYCSEQKSLKESNKAENVARNSKTEKTDPLEEARTVRVFPYEQVMGEDHLLEEDARDEVLERQNSTYFDALEKTLPDETGGAGEEIGDSQKIHQKPLEGILDLNAEFGVKETKPQFHPLVTPSDEKFLFTKESEETIFIKIIKSLKEDKISCSMALLEEFLKKIENSPDHKGTCFKLRQMLLLIENKSRNLMMSMEKKAWLKVLSLLEEVSQIFEDEDIEGSMRGHLQMTKTFINKIQALNVSRLVDLQNFCYTLCQQPTAKNDGNQMGKFFRKMCESLNFLKQKFTLKRNCIGKDAEKLRECENRIQDSESRFKVHSIVSLPEILGKSSWCKDKNQLEYLKRKIQQQKICIEELIEHDSDPVPQEIEDVKNKVANKMKWLEKMFEFHNLGESSKKAATWSKTKLLLEEVKTFKKNDVGRSGDKITAA